MELLVGVAFMVSVVALGMTVGGMSEHTTRGLAIGFCFGVVATIVNYLYAWGALPNWGWLPTLVGLSIVTVLLALVAPYVVVRSLSRLGVK